MQALLYGNNQDDEENNADSGEEDRAIVPKRRGRKRARYDFEETLISELEKLNEYDRRCFEAEEKRARYDERLRQMNDKLERMREERARMNEETVKVKAQTLFIQALKLTGFSDEDIRVKISETWNDDD
jgi:hypothetical protein